MRQWVSVPFVQSAPTPATNGVVAVTTPIAPPAVPRVFIALPTYNGWFKAQAIIGLLLASRSAQVHYRPGFGSLLAMNFNGLWCKALNSRAEGQWTDWCMHHADISVVSEGWLDTLLQERRRVGADILSVVVPIKDDRCLTSTGVVQPDGTIRRLTLKEVYRLPETFCEADLERAGIKGQLVVNTGLWVCDFTKPWVEEACFNIGDAIRKEPDGTFRTLVLPEDWNFSHWAGRKGLKVYATRKVQVTHWGEAAYGSGPPQGGWETDLGDDPTLHEMVRAARRAEGLPV